MRSTILWLLFVAFVGALIFAADARQASSNVFFEIEGQYSLSPEFCGDESPSFGMSLLENGLIQGNDSQEWAVQNFIQFSKGELRMPNFGETLAYSGLSLLDDGSYLVSTFAVIPDEIYAELGFPGDYPAERQPLAYVAHTFQDIPSLAEMSAKISSGTFEDHGLLYPC